MGRYKGKRKGRNKGGGKSRDDSNNNKQKYRHDATNEDFISSILELGNFNYEAYYATQSMHDFHWKGSKLVPCETPEEKEAERLRWRESAGRVLPVSFRIAKDVPARLREKLESELEQFLLDAQQEGESGEIMEKLEFLPHAYKLKVDRTTIKKKPELGKLHEWLKQQTQAGYITRQEVVSMVPPVVLAPQPGDCVLDMCAAPGSKTSQILEDLGPQGCVVANDANFQRAGMLVSQLRRIMHVNPGVIVTQCAGQFFPKIVQFDRILCDVPCTGDGTSRKNINVWQRWSQMGALAIHSLQLDIAWKGVSQLLKVGGYACYSTCSFNHIENEAVVAELLRRSNGALELVECHLDGLKVRPGASRWHVLCENNSKLELKNIAKKNNSKMQARRKQFDEQQSEEGEDKAMEESDVDAPYGEEEANEEMGDEVKKEDPSGAEEEEKQVEEPKKREIFGPQSLEPNDMINVIKKAGFHHFTSFDQVPNHLRRRVRPSSFPPTDEEAKKFHLERAIRCLPQDNDSGGFFVALLHKTGEIGSADRSIDRNNTTEPPTKIRKSEEHGDVSAGVTAVEEEEVTAEKSEEESKAKPSKGGKNRNPKSERDDFIPVESGLLNTIMETFGLNNTAFTSDMLMTRRNGNARVIFYVPRPVKDLIDQGLQDRVTMVGAGLKAFASCNLEKEKTYRICQESAHFLSQFMTKRRITAGVDDFRKCLAESRHIDISSLSEEIQPKVKELSVGSFVMVLDGYEDPLEQKMVVTLWRCKTERLDKLTSKVEVSALIAKLDALGSSSSDKK